MKAMQRLRSELNCGRAAAENLKREVDELKARSDAAAAELKEERKQMSSLGHLVDEWLATKPGQGDTLGAYLRRTGRSMDDYIR